uniref:RHO family interacting cell polarization regulator 1 n=1 Tax=Myripristis murdjan TaxID=586833 RepID=A0A668A0Y3_9TELE
MTKSGKTKTNHPLNSQQCLGSPSRTLSTMSLSARPARRLLSRSITRSQSFAGVNTYDKPYRNLSVFSTPGVTRKPSRASRMFTMSGKTNPPPKTPQPERLDEVYEALKKGLQSYLQVHQMELDSLSRQMKESKRNSRLVRSHHRMSHVLSLSGQIEELYEAYCLQRRLRDGADKMVKAYTASPGSREARESLSEANKGYKEYTENMCVLENELENQLGEFHIKMKGLAGFARLCAGDQYEIFMKYGRQRWRLRGRIEINAKQVWDSEEMVFLPLITEFLSIKVTELKSLANHVVVGSVSCETKDLFTALPQTVAVDINDLGTIKLSLEVTWNPFDKDDQTSAASSVNKAPTVNKRFSTVFNQSPPDTPSLREQAFYNMLRRHEELENGTAWSNSSESSDDSSSPQLSVGLRNSTHHKVTHCTLYAPSLLFSHHHVTQSVPPFSRGEDDQEVSKNQASTSSASRTESVDANTQSHMSIESSIDVTYVAHRVSVEDEETSGPGAAPESGEGERLVDSEVEDALGAVISSLDDYRGQFPELQLLEQELRLLQVTLKVRWKSKELKWAGVPLQRLGMFGPLRCGEMYALDRLLREARVLEIIRRIIKDNPRGLTQCDQGELLTCCSSLLTEQTVKQTMFMRLLERLLEQQLPRRGGGRDKMMVTVFQLWSYLEADGICDMDTHISELAEEVWLVQTLASCDQEVLVRALRRPPECSLKREGLHAVAKLLKDPRGKVVASASSLLRSLAEQPRHRERALVSCLELLEDENVETRVCGCKALACLKAKESIDQLVYLCQTDKEEVRDAAKQALLVLGEEGKMAHRHVETSQDGIPRLFAPGSMASTAF